MKKKILYSILAFGFLLLPGFSSASDNESFDIISPNGEMYYPDMISLSLEGDLSLSSFECDGYSCDIALNGSSKSCAIRTNNGTSITLNTCDSMPVGNYFVDYEISPFESFTLVNTSLAGGGTDSPIDPSPSVPEDPSGEDDNVLIPGLIDLVNNYGSVLIEWIPTVLVISLGVFAIFVFFRYLFYSSRKSFKG